MEVRLLEAVCMGRKRKGEGLKQETARKIGFFVGHPNASLSPSGLSERSRGRGLVLL
jgi:hypothetical protein